MLLEVTAPRILGPFFGTSAHTWTNVIGVVLAALATGYYLGGRLADRRPDPKVLYAVVMAGCIVAGAIPFGARLTGRLLIQGDLDLAQAYNLGKYGSLVTALLVFFPPAVLLGMVGPFAVRCLAGRSGVGRAAGTVFALGTIGSILGTFLPTFLLIPLLGSRLTVLLASAALFLVALVGLCAERGRRAMACAALLIVPASAILLALNRPIRGGPGLVDEVETPYHYIRVTRESRPEGSMLCLRVNEPVTDYQSVRYLGRTETLTYADYYGLLPWLAGRPKSAPLRVLILGLAAGNMSRLLHAYHDPDADLVIDGVEVDPGMVRTARRHFGLTARAHPHLRIHVMDGRLYLRTTRNRYDVIVVDCYLNQIYIPPHMSTVSFFREVRDRLAPHGILALNVSAHDPGRGLVPRLLGTVASVFSDVFVAHLPRSIEHMILAFRSPPARWPPAPAGDGIPRALRYAWKNLRRPFVTVRHRPDPSIRPFTDDDCPVEQLAHLDLAGTARRYGVLGRFP